MWSRKRLDIGWRDLFSGGLRCCLPGDAPAAAEEVEAIWPEPGHALACFSVRSGFDLLLRTLALPRGSEVLMSALTIPDMPRIVEHHGLVPVPVDLDPARMAPTEGHIARAITPASRAIVVAHLFGGRMDLGPILEIAREHGLLVLEDCAQAFAGPGYLGHAEADASMFSFGSIKSNTALGGAVLRVRDLELLRRMRAAQAAYPSQGRGLYFTRLLKYAALKTLSSRTGYGAFVGGCRWLGRDYDRWVNRMVRGFPGPDFFPRIRHRPSAPLLAVLRRRLRRFDSRRLAKHVAKGTLLMELLGQRVFCPGAESLPHTYWVFPILVSEPRQVIAALADAGFDATQGHSMCVIAPPGDRPQQKARVAEEVLAKVVFLPFYPAVSWRAVRRMAEVVLAHCGPKLRLSETPAADGRRVATVPSAG